MKRGDEGDTLAKDSRPAIVIFCCTTPRTLLAGSKVGTCGGQTENSHVTYIVAKLHRDMSNIKMHVHVFVQDRDRW